MNRLFLVLFIIVLAYYNSCTQTVLLEKNIKDNAYSCKNGPNMKKFSHIYFGYEFFADNPDDKGGEIIYGLSSCLNLGYRYKLKIFKFYSIGLNAKYCLKKYSIKQDENKILPNSELHDKEKIRFNNAGLEFYNRLNIDKRGNIIGKYLDIGFYTNWAFAINHYTKDKVYNENNKSELTIIRYTNLRYTEKINYGLSARLGINRVAISAEYRLSDLFKEEYQYPELPRFSVGLELAIYNK